MRSDASSHGRYFLAIVLLVFAMWVGLRVPDIDQRLLWLRHFVMHRSILTHGLLIPLVFLGQYWITGKAARHSDPVPRLGIIGLLIGLCVHLSFDLFPLGWRGSFGWIHIPLYGSTSPLFSQVWIAGNVLVGLYLGCRLLRSVNELFLALAISIVAFVLAAQSAYAPAPLYAFLTLGVLGAIAFVLPRPAVNHSDTATMPKV